LTYRQKAPQNCAYALKFHCWGFLRTFNPKSDQKSSYRVDVTLTLFSENDPLVTYFMYLILRFFFNVLSL
ncbi:hypothetical protein JJS02_RS22235, partial [Escherichia coli]